LGGKRERLSPQRTQRERVSGGKKKNPHVVKSKNGRGGGWNRILGVRHLVRPNTRLAVQVGGKNREQSKKEESKCGGRRIKSYQNQASQKSR